MKNSLLYLNLVIFLTILCNHTFSQNNALKLIGKINNDSEWNHEKYFKEIDQILPKSNSRDKITLYLIQSNFYAKLYDFEKAIQYNYEAEKLTKQHLINDSIRAKIWFNNASYYSYLKNYTSAYTNWVKANNYYTSQRNYPGMADCQILMAKYFIDLNEDQLAFYALKKAKKYLKVKRTPILQCRYYEYYSLYLKGLEKFDESLYYLLKSDHYETKTTINLKKLYNKGSLYLRTKDTLEGRLQFSELINNGKKINSTFGIAIGNYGMALSYLDNNPDKAYNHLFTALSELDEKEMYFSSLICECVLGKFKGKKYEVLQDFFERRKNYLVDRKKAVNESQLSKLLFLSSNLNEKLIYTQKLAEQKRLIAEKEKSNNLLITIITVSLIITLTIIVYSLKKTKKAKKIISVEHEKQKQLLARSLIMITNHNSSSESLSKKLKTIALNQTSKKLSDELYTLSKSITENAVGVKSKELKDLDLMIQSINDGFVKKLCEKHKDLTSNEIMLSIYLRMNFSTKQIAELKGVSENSIDISRSRLRAKLGLTGKSVDLCLFLNDLG